jgi:hypothetical protein
MRQGTAIYVDPGGVGPQVNPGWRRSSGVNDNGRRFLPTRD